MAPGCGFTTDPGCCCEGCGWGWVWAESGDATIRIIMSVASVRTMPRTDAPTRPRQVCIIILRKMLRMWTFGSTTPDDEFRERASTSRTMVEVWPRRNCLPEPRIGANFPIGPSQAKTHFYNILEKDRSTADVTEANQQKFIVLAMNLYNRAQTNTLV